MLKSSHAGGEVAEAGEERIGKDGDHHRLGAADAIAKDAAENAADAPADQEDRGGERGLVGDVRITLAEKVLHRRAACQVEQLLRHRVKHPAHAGDGEDEPVVAVEFAIPLVLWFEGGVY